MLSYSYAVLQRLYYRTAGHFFCNEYSWENVKMFLYFCEIFETEIMPFVIFCLIGVIF